MSSPGKKPPARLRKLFRGIMNVMYDSSADDEISVVCCYKQDVTDGLGDSPIESMSFTTSGPEVVGGLLDGAIESNGYAIDVSGVVQLLDIVADIRFCCQKDCSNAGPHLVIMGVYKNRPISLNFNSTPIPSSRVTQLGGDQSPDDT